jgi:DNA-binding MarR family transcriptional regulator
MESAVEVRAPVDRNDVGFLLAKSSQRWNELLQERFRAAGYGEIRASYGSVLVPLYEEDGLRMVELAERARLSKQTMTTLVRSLERHGLVRRTRDRHDGRAFRISLTDRAEELRPVAEAVLGDLDRMIREQLSNTEVECLRAALRKVLQL